MQLYFDHRWKKVEGIFVITVFSIWWGYGRVGLCVCNFIVEIDFEAHQAQ